jgi:hypothetical protein
MYQRVEAPRVFRYMGPVHPQPVQVVQNTEFCCFHPRGSRCHNLEAKELRLSCAGTPAAQDDKQHYVCQDRWNRWRAVTPPDISVPVCQICAPEMGKPWPGVGYRWARKGNVFGFDALATGDWVKGCERLGYVEFPVPICSASRGV